VELNRERQKRPIERVGFRNVRIEEAAENTIPGSRGSSWFKEAPILASPGIAQPVDEAGNEVRCDPSA